MGRSPGPSGGFTLIELMLVSAIISLLASIALPRFSNLITKSQEAAIQGHLGSMRSALTLYYADNEGTIPHADSALDGTDHFHGVLVPKYIREIPNPSIPRVPSTGNPGHPKHPPDGTAYFWDITNDYGGWDWDGAWPTNEEDDHFHWFYYGSGENTGKMGVMCTHKDSRGRPWSDY